jgi:hypothetical protein
MDLPPNLPSPKSWMLWWMSVWIYLFIPGKIARNENIRHLFVLDVFATQKARLILRKAFSAGNLCRESWVLLVTYYAYTLKWIVVEYESRKNDI